MFICLSYTTIDCQMMATVIRNRIEDFRPYIPLIQGLRNPGMRSRHWEMLSERTEIKVKPKANLTFSRCLELGLQNYVDDIAHVAEVAGKEYTIEQVYLYRSDTLSTVCEVLGCILFRMCGKFSVTVEVQFGQDLGMRFDNVVIV